MAKLNFKLPRWKKKNWVSEIKREIGRIFSRYATIAIIPSRVYIFCFCFFVFFFRGCFLALFYWQGRLQVVLLATYLSAITLPVRLCQCLSIYVSMCPWNHVWRVNTILFLLCWRVLSPCLSIICGCARSSFLDATRVNSLHVPLVSIVNSEVEYDGIDKVTSFCFCAWI